MADAVIRGQFDVSDIMSSLNTLYAEIKKNNKTPLLDNVDKEVKAIERLAQTLQAQATKGFTNDKEFKAYESNLNKLETMVIKVGQSFDRVNTKNLEIEIKNIKDSMKSLKEEADKLAQSFSQTLNGKFTSSKGVDFKEVNKGIAEAAAQGKDFAEALKLMRNYYDDLAKSATKSIFNENKEKYNAYKNNQEYIPATGLKTTMFNNISGKMGDYPKLREAFVEIAKQGKTAEESVKAFNDAIAQYNTSVKDPKKMEQYFTTYAQKTKDYENQVLRAKQVDKEYVEEKEKNLTVLTGIEKSYRETQAAGIKLQNQSADAEQKARDTYNQTAQAINNTNKANQQYIDTVRKSAAETKTAVTAQSQLNNTLDRLKSRITYVLSLTNVYYQLRRVLTQTLNDVNNIDKAFASIAMVTEKTVNGLWEHYGEYAQLAQKLGQSTESAIKTSALFYQQGLKDAEVMRLTEDTMKLATLAGLDFEKATSQMTAALRGFHMEMENSSHVTDVYSELAAHAAADVNGIAYAMSKTASIANNAGMSFENTAAFLTQMIETTQEAPENIGTALKTIIARFTELKENVAGTADSEFEDLDYNKVDKALKTVGVSLKDASGQFRNLDEVFLELSSKWDTLDRNSQRYIATIAAGSRQQSRFIAMMEDYDRTLELVSVTEDAKGRADEQFAKNAESLQFKLQSLKTAWEQLRLSFANSDFFKGVVDLMTKFVNILGKMDKTQMATVATIGIVMGKTIITNLLETIKQGASQIQTTLQQVSNTKFWKRDFFTPLKATFSGDQMNFTGGVQNLNSVLGPSSRQLPRNASNTFAIKSLEGYSNEIVQQNELLTAQKQELQEINTMLNEKNLTAQQYSDLQNRQNALERELIPNSEKLLQEKINLANETRKELGYEQQITAENAKQISQGAAENNAKNIYSGNKWGSFWNSSGGKMISGSLQSGLQASITTALMMGLSGADFSTVIKTAGTTALMAALPGIITAISEPLIMALTGPAGLIALIVVAAGVAVTNIIKKQNEVHNAEVARLNDVKKVNEQLQKQSEELISNYNKAVKEREKIEQYQSDIQKYTNKDESLLTDEERKRLTEAQDYIKDNYEDAYEITDDNHFKLIESKMDEILAEMRKNEQSDISEVYTNYLQSVGNAKSAYSLLHENQGWLTISGESYHLLKETINEAYSMYGMEALEGIDENLIKDAQKLSASELSEKYADVSSSAIINKIVENAEKLAYKDIEKANINAAKNALQIQGWDEEAAQIAAYLNPSTNYRYTDKTLEGLGTGFIEALSKGNFSMFGDKAEDVEKALQALGYGEGQDKQISDLFSSGTNVVKMEDLTPAMKTALQAVLNPNEAGTAYDDWFAGTRKDKEKMNERLLQVISAYMIDPKEFLSEEDQELFDNNREAFEEYTTAILDTSNKTFTEYRNNLDKIVQNAEGTTEEETERIQDGLNRYLTENSDNDYNKWLDNRKFLQHAGFDYKIWDKFDANTTQAYADLFRSLDEVTQKNIATFLNDYSNELSQKDWQILSALDLEDFATLGVNGAETYITQLTKAGHSAEEATRIFNDYIQKMSFATGKNLFLGEDSTNALEMQSDEKFKGLEEQFKTITKAEQEMLEQGFLNPETVNELKEANLEEYFTKGAKGYELLTDKVQEFYVKEAAGARKRDELIIENQKEKIRQLNDLLLDDDFQKKVTEYFSKTGEEREEFLTELSEDNLSYAIIIKNMADAGVKSLNEYINLANQGLVALNKLKENDAYNEVVYIKEHYDQAVKAVKELNDELDELNKTLEKNKETLDEAEQKYQEALHGSQYFTSSLDPLLNYDNALKSINNDLDNLKESLEDIDNIESGVDILNNLADSYDKKSATLSSENVIYGNAMANLRASMEDRFGNYVKFNGDDLFVDYSYTQMDANDAIRKALEESINTYNSYKEKRQSNDKELKKLDKERQQFEKDALKEYVDLQKDVIDILKAQAEEEVSITKDKYDALKDADNEYIDALEEAIQKQRDLRNRENEEEELAQKEKKLSLMRRDTSGANAKEIQSLEQEVENDREKLLDNSIDSIVNNMKELYEKQAEARDAEIEYMEAVTENAQYFSDWAASIMDSWNSQEDMQAWFLDNDKAVEDMTVEQQELYISNLKEKWTDLVTYQSTQLVNVNANMDNINQAMNNLLTNLDENATTKSQEIITTAQHTADEAIKSAGKARDSAKEAIEETEKKITELNQKMTDATKAAQLEQGKAMEAMTDASKSTISAVAGYAIKTLAEFMQVDLSDMGEAKLFAEQQGYVNKHGQYSEAFREAVRVSGGDADQFEKAYTYNVELLSGGAPTLRAEGFRTKEEAENFAISQGLSNYAIRTSTSHLYDIDSEGQDLYAKEWKSGKEKEQQNQEKSKKDEPLKFNKVLGFKKGGFADYTGPAWVDGTPSRPEAFLTAEDTERFSLAAELFATSPLLNSKMAQNNVSSSIGDTSIEININVESISDDYDVDRLIQRVEDDINETARPIGTQVILNKRV